MLLELLAQCVRCTLGATFLMSGMAEISPELNDELPFLQLFDEFSLVAPLLNYNVIHMESHELYRILIGTTELTCSVLILFGSGRSDAVALSYFVLLCVMCMVVYTHVRLGNTLIFLSVPLVYLVMLALMLKRSARGSH